MKQRGSAIIIAIFLITAVGSVAFGIGRLFALQSNISGFYENSTVAYYAAESGVEEGLLRYRHNKNASVAAGNFENISDLRQTVTTPNEPSKHFYGMQMSYLGKAGGYYGENIYSTATLSAASLQDAKYIANPELKITRDSSIKTDVTNLANVVGSDGGDLNLFLRPTSSPATCESRYGFGTGKIHPYVEAKVTGILNGTTIEEKVALIYSTTSTSDENIPASASPTSSPAVYTYSSMLTKIRNSRDTYAVFTSGKVELSLKSIGCDAYFGIKPVNSTKQVVQPYSTIKSTGYYGGVTRTLEARIDRQAGTLYDLFDFVIYDSN